MGVISEVEQLKRKVAKLEFEISYLRDKETIEDHGPFTIPWNEEQEEPVPEPFSNEKIALIENRKNLLHRLYTITSCGSLADPSLQEAEQLADMILRRTEK